MFNRPSDTPLLSTASTPLASHARCCLLLAAALLAAAPLHAEVPLPGVVVYGTVPAEAAGGDPAAIRGVITRDGNPVFEVPAEFRSSGAQTFYVLRIPLESASALPGPTGVVARAGDRLSTVLQDGAVIARPDLELAVATVERVDTVLAPRISVEPRSLDFDRVAIADSVSLAVDIRNVGSAPLNVSRLVLSGAGRTSFRVAQGTAGFTLEPGVTQRRDIVFEPSTAGPRLAELEVESDDPESPTVRVALSGEGFGVPQIAVERAPIEFGEVELDLEVTRSVTIRNLGTGTLTLTRVALAAGGDPDFTILAGGGAGTLASNATRRIEIAFRPIEPESRSATLRIDSDDPDAADTSIEIPLAGVGLRAGGVFRRGDADINGRVELTDAIFTLNFLFLGGAAPRCREAADSNDSGVVDLTDAIVVLNFLFLGGRPPPVPGPTACGSDPAGSADLGCETYDRC